ncbi:DUF6228 family protein [Kitasatospora sp. NBC_01560]|uniref:DUF6228 family protein n=1 Tax=Kitasatospora sp. NBC_01560 TaxID=2975965 RepID=UPI003865BBF5
MNADNPDAAPSAEVVIRCSEDPRACVTLTDRDYPDQYGVAFSVSLRGEGLHARVEDVKVWVWDGEYLFDFLDGLAADFRGWDGERTWQTNHLALSATFHSGGHVCVTWSIQPRLTARQTWAASITTWLEAGQQMADLAADVRDFLRRQNGAY